MILLNGKRPPRNVVPKSVPGRFSLYRSGVPFECAPGAPARMAFNADASNAT
jgi:hypothetical protein